MSQTPHVLLLFLYLQVSAYGVEYGPSIASLTGVFVNWKGPDLLAIESGRKVKLDSYPGFSTTLPLISRYSAATSEQIFRERGISTVGEFVVEAPKGFGLIVVIQELKLRQATRDRGNPNVTVTCSDYIQIGDTRSDDNGPAIVSDKICGTVLRDDLNSKPKGLLGPRSFKSPSGQVRVAFNHAYVAELVYSLLGSKQKHILKAELTFTAYKSGCSEGDSAGNSTSEDTYEICSDYKNTANLTCISSKLICDEVYNCGGDGETLGSDDNFESCPDRPVRTTESTISPEDNVDAEEKQGLSDLSTYLGLPSLSSYTTKRYERKFKSPSYVSGSSSGSGFLYDYTTRRPLQNPSVSSTTEPSPGGSIEINVIGPTRDTKSLSNLASSNSQDTSNTEFDSEVYSRRELANAINSVIYGVAVFIIFTIFITVFVVCLTKKIQTTWIARQERRTSSVNPESNPESLSIPGILPVTTLTSNINNRRSSECNPGAINADAVIIINELVPDDPPPAYESIFPTN